MRFAITKPTGKIGRRLVRELLDRGGHELALLTRDQKNVRDEAARGAQVFEGKLEDKNFFTGATKGVDALFLVIPMDSRSDNIFEESRRITESACDAITANKIQRVVFVSSLGAHIEKGTGPIRYLREAERELKTVTPNLTVLRPVFFMDQVMGWMKEIAENKAVYMPFSDRTNIPMIAARDVATYAADVLTDTRWTGRRVLSLHGPREYSYGDVARILGTTLGMEVRPVELKPEELREKLRVRGWSQPAVEHNLELHQSLAQGKLKDELPAAERIMRPTTFEQFAKEEFQPAFDRFAAAAPSL